MTWLEEHKLSRYYEMAETDKEIKFDLQYPVDMIQYHFTKLYYFYDSDNRNHWIQEIWAFLHKVNKRKSTNKFPDKEFIFKNTFEKQSDCFYDWFNGYIKNLKFKYNFAEEQIDEGDSFIIFNICRDYFVWLSEQLSLTGEVSLEEVFNKIEELLNR